MTAVRVGHCRCLPRVNQVLYVVRVPAYWPSGDRRTAKLRWLCVACKEAREQRGTVAA